MALSIGDKAPDFKLKIRMVMQFHLRNLKGKMLSSCFSRLQILPCAQLR